ncbi:hypothetical protein ABEX78_21350 [Priestia megaterium]
MKKYTLKWANGNTSAFPLTKEQVINALNTWKDKKEHWAHIEVQNITTKETEVYFQEQLKYNISDLEI